MIELLAEINSILEPDKVEIFSTIVFVECDVTGAENANFFFGLFEQAKQELYKLNSRLSLDNISIKNCWLMDSGIFINSAMKKV